jgi:hypothetical protein
METESQDYPTTLGVFMKAEITLDKDGFGPNNKIAIDGIVITNFTKDVAVHGGVGNTPEVILSLYAYKCEMTVEGDLVINDIETPPGVDRQLYNLLKEKFEGLKYDDRIKKIGE